MDFYIVENHPVSVYSAPGAAGRVINAFPVGSRVNIISEDAGWLKTDGGGYIFKTNDIISFRQYRKKHINDLVLTDIVSDDIPTPLRKRMMPLGSTLTAGSLVRVKNPGAKDPVSGNPIPSSWSDANAALLVTEVDGSVATVEDKSSGAIFRVNVSDLEMFDTEDKEWTDVSTTATVLNDSIRRVTNAIQEFATGVTGLASDNLIANLDVKNIRKIQGMPYQFLPWADNRLTFQEDAPIDETKFGRKYAQKIATRAPILVMKAGTPDFMRGYSRDENKTLMNQLRGAAASLASLGDDSLEQLVNTPGKLYSLKDASGMYFTAVDQMCQAMANLLGISDVSISIAGEENTKIGDINWMKISHTPGFGYLAGSVGFYINSEPQINEAFSNVITDSQLAQKMNDLGRMGSELQFYLGGISNYTSVNLSGAVESVLGAGTVSNGAAGVGGLIDTLIDNVQTVISGGRMIFPKIWSDHNFTRSYGITMKFDSPDCDNVSIFLNVLVPLAHVLAFVLPRHTGANNYISPFLVRAYYKSMFHIDMGIITDCQITKGDVGAWTQNGLPTQITVSLTINDLYNVISLATGIRGGNLLGNAGQMDYIANLCGINIDEPDLWRAIKLWNAVKNPLFKLDDYVYNLFQTTSNQIYDLFSFNLNKYI